MFGRRGIIRLAVLAGIVLLLGLSAFAAVRWYQRDQTEQETVDAAAQAAAQLAADRLAFFTTTNRLILFHSLGEASTTLYGSNTLTQALTPLETDQSDLYSNYLPGTQHWYTVTGQTVWRHGSDAAVTVASLTQAPVVADAVSTQPSLAIDASEQYLAWVSRLDRVESIRILNLETLEETELYQGETAVRYSNLTWSPDGTELAFTANHSKLITITTEGAETHSPISLPFHEFRSLTWLTYDQFGTVVTSTDANPEPFQPKVIVLNRQGDVMEEHAVFEKIGVPTVLWSADGDQFMFYDPWRNTFMVYDRFDRLIQSLVVAAPGKLVPFGYQAGTGPIVLENTTQTELTPDTTTTTTVTEPFEVSADDWERYNNTVRNILKQWGVDFTTYRFATTDEGIQVSFHLTATTEPNELVFIQTILQIFATLPNLPSINIILQDSTGNTLWEVDRLSLGRVNDVSQLVTNRTVDELFVINTRNPIGKRVAKPNQPEHHFVGDFVYSQFGDYNPYPVLALLGATTPTQQFFTTGQFTLLHPSTLSIKTIDDRTTLFYTTETTFLSTSAWSDFGITIESSDAPNVTIEQWLSVSRPDQVAALPSFTVRAPADVRQIATGNDFSAEYVVLADNTAYVLTIQRDNGLTDADRVLLQSLTESFSLLYAIQRY
ncbi:MAG: WD40 repeat domain-containing protein [Candidatus Kerfeldbacteria bacterium]|nr:WD40 repeat domain-containing protein [Candidatus Kerfeldbacteria bacterium]